PLCSNSASACMYVCAICSVSNLDSFLSLPSAGTTSRRRSYASFSPCIRRLSRLFACMRRFLLMSVFTGNCCRLRLRSGCSSIPREWISVSVGVSNLCNPLTPGCQDASAWLLVV
ncbi:unnamed protein product, partial [Meganyctiphanes norvegica]